MDSIQIQHFPFAIVLKKSKLHSISTDDGISRNILPGAVLPLWAFFLIVILKGHV